MSDYYNENDIEEDGYDVDYDMERLFNWETDEEYDLKISSAPDYDESIDDYGVVYIENQGQEEAATDDQRFPEAYQWLKNMADIGFTSGCFNEVVNKTMYSIIVEPWDWQAVQEGRACCTAALLEYLQINPDRLFPEAQEDGKSINCGRGVLYTSGMMKDTDALKYPEVFNLILRQNEQLILNMKNSEKLNPGKFAAAPLQVGWNSPGIHSDRDLIFEFYPEDLKAVEEGKAVFKPSFLFFCQGK